MVVVLRWLRLDDTGVFLSILVLRATRTGMVKWCLKVLSFLSEFLKVLCIVKEKGWRWCSFASSMGRMRTRMAIDGLYEYRCISSLHPDCIIFI